MTDSLVSNTMEQLRRNECLKCGALLVEGAAKCWMCRELHGLRDAKALELATARPVDEPSMAHHGVPSFSLATLFAVITAVAVGLGLATWQPAAAVAYGLLVFIPLMATVVSGIVRRSRGRQVGWKHRIIAFAVSTFIVIWTLIALAIAAFIALLIACANQGPMTFH